ncbi:MAG: CO dehydrogenase/CO-methylating acetyl-CoA synthase complex subunit beta, partial [Methanoregula sp.]|nr:CO dehydrogenase/CO-methylating acetyl-CoA synthase complex subunit beta [Methanoregula sp.]
MVDVEMAKKNGEAHLKTMLTTIQHVQSYEETAYHLPVSFALTGIIVHDQKTALDVFEKTGRNPLVALECILAGKTAAEGKLSAPYTGFIDDTIIRKLGYSLVDGSILGLALVVGTPS